MGPAVVGIGDFLGVARTAEVAEKANLRLGGIVGSHVFEVFEIGSVHCQNEIEAFEIGLSDSTRSTGHG